MFLQKTRYDVRTERERDAAVVLAPACDVLIRVRPQKVTEQATVGNLNQSARPSHPEKLSIPSVSSQQHLTQVAYEVRSTYISWSHYAADLLHGIQIWT